MFRLLVVCGLFIFSMSVWAKPISFNFNRIDLNAFLDATYGEVLHRNFVQSPELLNQGRKVSLRITIDDTQLPTFLAGFLDQLGIEQQEQNSVLYLRPKSLTTSAKASSAAPEFQNMRLPLHSGAASDLGASGSSTLPVLQTTAKNARVYSPIARSPDFLCLVINSVSGQGSCHVAGMTLVLMVDDDFQDKVTHLLEKVDRVVPRVQLSATFIEVGTNGREGFGLSLMAGVLGTTLGMNIGTPSSNGAISVKGANFSAVLDALKSDGRFRQVAAPSGFVNAGEHFTITIGDEVPTLGNVQQDNKGNAVQSVVYRSSGVILDVVPRVVQGDTASRVEATVKAQVSSFSSTATGVNNSPTLSKREVNTSLTLDDGEIVILGGLNGSKMTNNGSHLFGMVPFGESRSSESTELLLVLTAALAK